MKPKVYITRKIPDEIVSKIKEVCEVRMWQEEEKPVPREVLEKEIADVDGLFCLLTESIDRTNALKVISNMAVGSDLPRGKPRGFQIPLLSIVHKVIFEETKLLWNIEVKDRYGSFLTS